MFSTPQGSARQIMSSHRPPLHYPPPHVSAALHTRPSTPAGSYPNPPARWQPLGKHAGDATVIRSLPGVVSVSAMRSCRRVMRACRGRGRSNAGRSRVQPSWSQSRGAGPECRGATCMCPPSCPPSCRRGMPDVMPGWLCSLVGGLQKVCGLPRLQPHAGIWDAQPPSGRTHRPSSPSRPRVGNLGGSRWSTEAKERRGHDDRVAGRTAALRHE